MRSSKRWVKLTAVAAAAMLALSACGGGNGDGEDDTTDTTTTTEDSGDRDNGAPSAQIKPGAAYETMTPRPPHRRWPWVRTGTS